MRKRKKSKQIYRLRNWREYNASLVQRGSLTVWIAEDTLSRWQNPPRSGKRGRPPRYTDLAIECMATLEAIYHLPLRATEGLLASVLKLMGVRLPVPDYTALCRRRKRLAVLLPRRARSGRLPLVVDSSVVKIFGEGEWKVRSHGASKRRTWRKLHIGVDEATHELVAAVVTTNDVAANEVLPDLLDQVEEELEQVTTDGAYDKRHCYRAIAGKSASAVIPPRKNARIWQHGRCKKPPLARDENLRRIREVGGRTQWKRERGYHRRSLAETSFSRIPDDLWRAGQSQKL